MSALEPKQSYSRDEVRRAFKLSHQQLRSWEKQRLLPAAEVYGFSDLVALRTLLRLRERRVPPARIRDAVRSLRRRLGDSTDPLRDLRIFVDGRRVVVQLDDRRMEPVSGQLLLDFDEGEINRLLAFPGKRTEESTRLAAEKQRLEAEHWFQEGLERERTGAPLERILEAYQKAVELDPQGAGAWVNLGTVQFNARAWDQAEQCYRKALEADPKYALAHFNLGNLCDERNDHEQALVHYRAALGINPSYSDAHYNLALLYQSSGETMSAVRHWKAYLKLDPASTWAVIARRELDKLRRALLAASGSV
ncbi:MAG: tetratricopeptide repeat protein [Acidobacteria bacterium]|nr:tetratricopeptide repeat protein [Acidobacteriota bacterium]